jgi:2-polyprenyl-3-methyl-5-hydroxy-6-metoxy-1,4-benzoquinol methylase
MELQVPELQQHELGYWEVKNKPSEQSLSEYYEQKYYQQLKGSHQKEYSSEELAFFRAKVSQRSAMIQRVLPSLSGLDMLDVGCGEGFELAYFLSEGWNVKGIDFSSDGMKKQNPECLPFLQTGNIYQLLDDEIKSGNQYSVVWLQNVLEHVIDPQALLKQLKKLVKANGVAVITVPNDFSALQTELIDKDHIDKPFWVALPDHLSYFSAPSLSAIAEYTGWNCLSMTADFPIDWFLMNPGSNYIMDQQNGKPAHHARVALENLIQEQPVDKVLNFFESLASLGMGRNITAYLSPQS